MKIGDRYYIAGIRIQLVANEKELLDSGWTYFAVGQKGKIAYCVRIEEISRNLDECHYSNVQAYHVSNVDGKMLHILQCNGETMICNSMYNRVIYLPLKDEKNIDVLLLQLFYTHAVRRQMLQLHCATIDDDGRGILFLGPSGIGKTTQAERWAQYRGSAIINGDIGFVQRTDTGYTAWGTPWHGSSPYCLNASVPVRALVVLKQAPQNALRELTGFEKVREVSGSVFYPTWLEDGMELCTDTLNHLLSDLPVYRLDNRADEEAVRLLAAEIDRIS